MVRGGARLFCRFAPHDRSQEVRSNMLLRYARRQFVEGFRLISMMGRASFSAKDQLNLPD